MSRVPDELLPVAERFRRFAKHEARGYCRFYEELCLRIADLHFGLGERAQALEIAELGLAEAERIPNAQIAGQLRYDHSPIQADGSCRT